MRIRLIISGIVAAILLGIGVLAGSVMGAISASAQAPMQVPTAAPSAPNSGTTTAPQNKPGQTAPGIPKGGRGFGGFGGPGGPRGFGPGGPGPVGGKPGLTQGFDPGGFGPNGQANANGATRAISSTTSEIALVKSDLAYANGKMDTTDVQRWVNGADSLLATAQSASGSSQYGQAIAYARAASELAEVAEQQMADKLGADKLPSYTQRPQRPNRPSFPNRPNPPSTGAMTVTQAIASRILRSTYGQLITEGALVKNAANPGDATTYLTDAQNAYRAAYSSYQSGNYGDALASARIAGQLAGVSSAILEAETATNDQNTPVTVPAPNFQ